MNERDCENVCVRQRKRGKSSGKRMEKRREISAKKNVKSDLYFATRKSALQHVYLQHIYFPRFLEYMNFVRNFLFDGRMGRERVFENTRTLTTPPSYPEETETRILSQFCGGMVQLRTMNNDRFDGLLLFRNFCCRGSSCDRALTTSKRYSRFSAISSHLQKTRRYTHRPIITAVTFYGIFFIHVFVQLPLKSRCTSMFSGKQEKTGTEQQ